MAVQGAGDPGWGMRASDMDREAVVAALRDAYIAGRLTLDEFDERTSAAYAGKTWGELRVLAADLPEMPEMGADLPGPPAPPQPVPVPVREDPLVMAGRVAPVTRSRPRPRLWPITLVLVLGLATDSWLLTLVAVVTGVVSLVAVSFIEGWRNGGKEQR
jgi:uncharacterized protein DUF1707